ncbi:hypothetical protein RCH18_002394 [Flavobacterium sp. PL11]|uniref:ice-binding family protein n=1 Tax=Flavobacterium sp. PL11 TaxID=3071717 RepID=UPI002DFA1FD6|nr:hypothetical protein [Flavobacterium sp. PL11]
MKIILSYLFLQLILWNSTTIHAQIGIGTITPNASSALDIVSETKGLLIPRLTTIQKEAIKLPATGLMIFNTTVNDCQINVGTPEIPKWTGMKSQEGTTALSVTQGNLVSTSSTVDVLIEGMTISPPAGTYMILFDGQMSSNKSFSTDQGATGVDTLYTQLLSYPGGMSHALVFGNDEVLSPGVYDVSGAPSIAGKLTLDGNDDPNSLFIIRGTGAFTTGASTVVELIKGADAKNVFWLSAGAMSTGADTTMKGTMIANSNAIALGPNTKLEGRMFSTIGALTMGAGSVVSKPTGISSSIDLGVLQSFAMFTKSGAISGCAGCAVTGDVGTGAGAATDFNGITGTVFPPGTTSEPTIKTYTVYKKGIEVPYSSRSFNMSSAVVNLQAMIVVADGDSIEIRWKVDSGDATIGNRTLSLLRTF